MLAAQGVSNLSMLAFHHVLSLRLGPAYAQLVALMAVWNVVANVTLGLNTYLVKVFSEDAEKDGPGAVKGRLWSLVKPGLLLLALMTSLLALAAPLIQSYLRLPSLFLGSTVAVMFVTWIFALVLRSAQQGLLQFGWLGLSLAGEGLARLVVFCARLQSALGGMAALAWGQFFGGICAGAGFLGLEAARTPVRRARAAPREGLLESGSDTVALTLLALLSYLDVVVLKHHYTDDRASLYSRAALVAKSFLYLTGAFNMVLLAAAARERAGGRDPRGLLLRFLGAALALDALGLAFVWRWTGVCLGIVAGFDPGFRTPPMERLTRWFSVATVPLGLLQLVIAYLLAVRKRWVAPALGLLVLLYLGALSEVWDNELKVVACLGACAALGLCVALSAALAPSPPTVEPV